MDLPAERPRRIDGPTTFVTDPEDDQDAVIAFECPRPCCRRDTSAESPPGYWGWRREK